MAKGNNSGGMSTRNRASPARIVKLYKHLTKDQKSMIHKCGFGSLLQIACDTIPGDSLNGCLLTASMPKLLSLYFLAGGKLQLQCILFMTYWVCQLEYLVWNMNWMLTQSLKPTSITSPQGNTPGS